MVIINIKIYYDFKLFYIKYGIDKIYANFDNIMKSDIKFRIYYNKWNDNLDFSGLINEIRQKFANEVLMFVLYSYDGKVLYSSMIEPVSKNKYGLERAMAGEVYYSIESVENNKFYSVFKSMNIQYVNEMYIPIKYNMGVLGILHVYISFDKFHNDINNVRMKATFLAVLGFMFYVIALYFVVHNIDIRETKLLERVQKMEKLSTLGQFASKMAHEIGTPLNVIRGMVEIMEEECKCDQSSKRVDIITRQIDKINLIVRNYLYATRKPEPYLKKVNIKLLMEQIAEEFNLIIDDNIKIELDLYNKIIDIDPVFLEQVLINIVKNACDAIATREGYIKIFFTEDDNYLYVNIKDNGPGIPEEIRDKIFDPFFSTKKSGKGTGLGLAVCKELMGSMNGTISFISDTKGTQFILGIKKC